MSVVFIACVILLHIFGKLTRAGPAPSA